MIINIRGTSGSGKSTLVRRVMEHPSYGEATNHYMKGRKQPLGYIFPRKDGPDLAIVGHYETACGGCDTINKMENIFRLVRISHMAGNDVIFEGLLISADVNRTQALHDEGLPLAIVGLDKVPLDLCLESVNGRRLAADETRRAKVINDNIELFAKGRKTKPVPSYRGHVAVGNTTSKFKGVQQSMKRLEDANVATFHCDREGAYGIICNELGLKQ